jgi:pimeloyl-ACP methyl ester carboxylesterase
MQPRQWLAGAKRPWRFHGMLLAIAALVNAALASTHPAARIEGDGPVTVVFASGLGDTLEVWSDVQPAIAEDCARTFAYNRAGYVGGDPATGRRDAATIVAELRADLARRGIAPPYVLVGHSIGGLYMQYFAREYADEVQGVLLVDSTHWNQQLPTNMGKSTRYGRQHVLLYMPYIMRRELADSGRAGDQVRTSPPARDLPTIVLSSTRPPRGETPAQRVASARLQDEIVADFPGAKHVRVENSGHYIQHDHPRVVIDAARKLAGCPPLTKAHPSGSPL